jgi:acetylornithine deacetylase
MGEVRRTQTLSGIDALFPGGADMKCGGAANLFALDALKRIGLQPAAPVTVVSPVEEESTGNGTLMAHIQGYRADAVLIP